MAKIITRREVNEIREGTYSTDLDKVVLYGDDEIVEGFGIKSINSITKQEYRNNQALLQDDIQLTSYTFNISGPGTVGPESTSSTFTIESDNVYNIGWDQLHSSSINNCTINGNNATATYNQNAAETSVSLALCLTGQTSGGMSVSATTNFTQEALNAYINISFNREYVDANEWTNEFTLDTNKVNDLEFYEDGSQNVTDCSVINGDVSFDENNTYSERTIILAITGTSTVGTVITGTASFIQYGKQDNYTFEITPETGNVPSTREVINISIVSYNVNDIGYDQDGSEGITYVDVPGDEYAIAYFSQNTTRDVLEKTVSLSGRTGGGQIVYTSTTFTQSAAVDTDFSFTCQTPYIGPGPGSTSGLSMTFTNSSLSSVTVPQGCSYSTGGTATQMILTFTYGANTGSDVKTYTITAVATDVYNRQISRSVTITQLSESINFISVTPDGTSIGPEASSVTFGVSWNYASTGTQITFTTEDGITATPTPISVESMNGSSNITVQISENDTDSGRTPTLTATMTDVASGSHSDSGRYEQEAKVSKFDFRDDFEVAHIVTSTAATYTYQYIGNNSADLIVEGGAYFDTEHTQTATTINISSNVKGSGSIRIYFDENPEVGDGRTFTITASGMEDDEGETVTGKTSVDITQLGYHQGLLICSTPKRIPPAGGTARFVVDWLGLSTNNNYIVVNSGMTVVTRIKVTREKSNPAVPETDRTFEVIIGENTTGSDRVLQFPLTTTDKWGQEVKYTAEITQSGGL